MHFHRLHAHDIGHLASVPRVIVLRFGNDRQHALGEATLRTIHGADLFVVSVPDDLRGWISAARSTGQFQLLSAFHCLTLGVPLDVRHAGWIWKIIRSCDSRSGQERAGGGDGEERDTSTGIFVVLVMEKVFR